MTHLCVSVEKKLRGIQLKIQILCIYMIAVFFVKYVYFFIFDPRCLWVMSMFVQYLAGQSVVNYWISTTV